MAVSLTKGGNVSLTKQAPGLSAVFVGLGWDTRVTDGAAFDLDASAFLLGAGGKVRSDADFIFYNQPQSADGSVVHKGDNLTGVGEGDDEVVAVSLAQLPADVERIAFTVTIHEADQRRQNFGMVQRAFIRVVNQSDGTELARYDLSEDASVETAMIFGELYRDPNEAGGFKFKARGEGFAGGLGALAGSMGVNI
ncbi:TerD family protein [Novosphingobium sp.]|uniref:TerD family protein n=1 Tax=Novosphingobium sp. TaxID=1874826 RepID=UPI0025E72667|nr:TerD family protein [Novosphingobium sp.]MCC6926712.1 TerD family protein [Novosphingobium sp.]